MQTASAFGFSGPDFLGEYAGNAMSFAWNGKDLHRNVRYQKRLMNFQNAMNRQNQIWTANNMPSLTVQGLRNANLNPLLAYSDFSGLSSSGAMGVSPATVSGGSYSNSDTHNGFDIGSFDNALDIVANGHQRRENKKELGGIISQEIGTRGDIADIDREHAPELHRSEMRRKQGQAELDNAINAIDFAQLPAIHSAKRDLELQQSRTAKLNADADQIRAEMNAFRLEKEYRATTGHNSSMGFEHFAGDQQNEFWNDYFREKLDADKWMHSAKRQYMQDGLDGAKTIFDIGKTGAETFGELKGKGKGKSLKKRRH